MQRYTYQTNKATPLTPSIKVAKIKRVFYLVLTVSQFHVVVKISGYKPGDCEL